MKNKYMYNLLEKIIAQLHAIFDADPKMMREPPDYQEYTSEF